MEETMTSMSRVIQDWKNNICAIPNFTGHTLLENVKLGSKATIGGVEMERNISDMSLLSNFSQVGSIYHDALSPTTGVEEDVVLQGKGENLGEIAQRIEERVVDQQDAICFQKMLTVNSQRRTGPLSR